MSQTVIFLKRSDAPVHSKVGIRLRWDQLYPRFAVLRTDQEEVIKALRADVKTGVGSITEVTEEELETEKKTLKFPEPQVHREQEWGMRSGMSHENPQGTGSRNQPDAAVSDSGGGSASPEDHPVTSKPTTIKSSDLNDAP